MNIDRFSNFDSDVRTLVLAFEEQNVQGARFFDVDELAIVADYYLEVNDVEGLAAAVAYGERLFPTSNEIKLRRAHLLGIQGDYHKALELLKKLEAAEPDNTDVSYALGALYSMTDHSHTAISYYLKAATDGFELDMIYGNIGDEYHKLGLPDESIRYYKMSIEKNPEEDRSLYNLACTWDEQGQNDISVEYFTQHVTDHPYSKAGWYCLGCVYTWLSLYEKSADAFEYALAIDKSLYNAYLGLADCYRYMGDYARAVLALRDSLDYSDDRPYIIYRMGSIYLEAGNYHTASTYFHDALKEDPSFSLAWNDLGRCCEHLGCIDEAAGYFRRAIDLDPDSDEHWLCLADLYLSTERYAEACALLESARIEAASLFEFDLRLLYCYYKLGRRNRFFGLIRQDAPQYGSMFKTLLSQFPELQNDIEIVNYINTLSI